MRARFACTLAALSIAACKGGSATSLGNAADAAAPVESASATAASVADASSASPGSLGALGPAHVVDAGMCGAIGRPGGSFPQYLARRDLTTSFVDGDSLLALMNRSPLGSLAPDYAPSDMVDLYGGKAVTAHDCDVRYGACLRREAAEALHALMAAMKTHGFEPRIESAYRSYTSQCGVFYHWATKDRDAAAATATPSAMRATSPPETHFCDASEQSALAGHSQHQLGTTVDLFTEGWFEEDARNPDPKKRRGSFRDGFGCTPPGQWIADNAWQFGFVLPYPIAPDDRNSATPCLARWDLHVPPNPRTGYRNEPWHLRYIGVDDAASYHDAWTASGPGTADEITLEQWLRRRAGMAGDADLPVCDGCSCGACATLAKDPGDDAGAAADPCADSSLWLDANGAPRAPDEAPEIVSARATRTKSGVEIDVEVRAPPHTVTQPPVFDGEGPRYEGGATYMALVPYGRGAHHYDDLPGAWRVAIAADSGDASSASWPWRASLAKPRLARSMNRANLYLPAQPGDAHVKVVLAPPPGATRLEVTLLRDGQEHGTRAVDIPPP